MFSSLRYLQRQSFKLLGNQMKSSLFIKGSPLIYKSILITSLGITTSLGIQNIRMEIQDQAQSTVISDTHPTCAVLIIDIKSHVVQDQVAFKKILNIVKQFQNIPKTFNVQKNNEDDELDPLLIGIGFDTRLWEQISKKQQKHYETRTGKYGSMPLSQGNLAIHIKAETYSLAYQTVQEILHRLPKDTFNIVQENYGFKYKDGRDLSGFLDGTMNPAVTTHRAQAGITQSGGSYLIHQIWKHNIDHLNQQPIEEQEKWVGRLKQNSAELKDLHPESHVSNFTQGTRDENKQRIMIVRQSMPFGTVSGTHGLLFIAYSNSVDKFDKMLDRMVGIPDEHNDSIMKFSNCYFGNYYYVPSLQELLEL